MDQIFLADAYKEQSANKAGVTDIVFALKLFNINSRTQQEKKIGQELLPFISLFNPAQELSQSFSLSLLPQKILARFHTQFQKILVVLLTQETDHTKQAFLQNLINLAK